MLLLLWNITQTVTKRFAIPTVSLTMQDQGCAITPEMYEEKGYTFFVFHFGEESGPRSRDHATLKKSGSCRLDITFTASSTNPALTVVLYQELDETLSKSLFVGVWGNVGNLCG